MTKKKFLEEHLRDLQMLNKYYGPVIWMMISWARGVRGLRRIHNLLPDNQRLLRDDQIKLDEVWMKINGGKTLLEGDRPDDETILRVMSETIRFAPERVHEYYKHKLPHKKTEYNKHSLWVRTSDVDPDDLFEGHDIRAAVPGLPTFWAKAKIDHVNKKLWVSLNLEDEDLSEPVTRALLDHAPLRSACVLKHSSAFSSDLQFFFGLDIQGFPELLGELHNIYREQAYFCIEGFLPLLQQRLIEAGLEEVELAPFAYDQYTWYCKECKRCGIINHSKYGRAKKSKTRLINNAHSHSRPFGYRCEGYPERITPETPEEVREEVMKSYKLLE